MRARSLVATLLALAACGGGDSTAPTANSDISGDWSYNATNLSGSGLSCNISGVTISLKQTGSAFTGSTSGGTISCSALGETETQDLGIGTIANGQVNGNSIQFDIGTSNLHNSGTRSGNSITGTLTARVDIETTTLVLSGNFSLVKK